MVLCVALAVFVGVSRIVLGGFALAAGWLAARLAIARLAPNLSNL